MALRKLGVVGALVMGFIVTPDVTLAYSTPPSSGEYLAQRMHQEGIRKPVDPRRTDLRQLIQQARRYADQLDLGCESRGLYEVRLIERDQQWIAGYSAKLDCEDAPSPISMYFDVNLRFLSAFEHGV